MSVIAHPARHADNSAIVDASRSRGKFHSQVRRAAGSRTSSWRNRAHRGRASRLRSEEHTSELQSLAYLVCRLLLEKKKKKYINSNTARQTETMCTKPTKKYT